MAAGGRILMVDSVRIEEVPCRRLSGAGKTGAASSPIICTGINLDAASCGAQLAPPFVQLGRMDSGLTRQRRCRGTRFQRRRNQPFLLCDTPPTTSFNRRDHLDLTLGHVTKTCIKSIGPMPLVAVP